MSKYKPSKRKLTKATNEGNLPRSNIITQATVLIGTFAVAKALGRKYWELNKILLHYCWGGGEGSSPTAGLWLVAGLSLGSIVFFLSLSTLFAWIVESAQHGVYFLPNLLVPKLERCNPVAGVKRLVSSTIQGWRVAVRVFMIVPLAYWVIRRSFLELPIGATSLGEIGDWWDRFFAGCIWCTALYFVLGVGDYAFARWQWYKKLMMTREEMKQEHKNDEGDPHVRSQRKRQHQAMLNEKLISKIRSQKVIVVG